jgi:hypothetical protein
MYTNCFIFYDKISLNNLSFNSFKSSSFIQEEIKVNEKYNKILEEKEEMKVVIKNLNASLNMVIDENEEDINVLKVRIHFCLLLTYFKLFIYYLCEDKV